MIMAMNSRTIRILFRAALLLLLLACTRHPAPRGPGEEVEAQYLATLRAISEGHYPRAVLLCKDIISRDPAFFRAYARLVDAAAAEEALDPVIAYLDSLRGDPQRSGFAHYGLGVAYDAAGQYEAAAVHFQHAITQAPQLSDAYGYKGLVDARVQLNQPEAALAFFRDRLATDPENANLHYGIGYTYRKLKQYPEALEALTRSLRLEKNLWQAYRSIGLIHFFQGDYRRALDFWTAEERVDDRSGNIEARAQVIGNIGAALLMLGEYPRALLYSRQALKIDRQTGNEAGAEKRLSNIGSIYLDLGDYPQAVEYYREAQALAEKLEDRERQAANLLNLGIAAFYEENYPEMNASWEAALALYRELDDVESRIMTLSNMAYTRDNAGEYDRAAELLEEALNLADEVQNPGVLGDLRNNRGAVNLHRGMLRVAMADYETGLAIGRQVEEPQIIWEAYGGIGDVLAARGEAQNALASYKRAIETIEQVRETLGGEEFKSGYLKNKIHLYEKTIRLQIKLHGQIPEQGFDREAFHYAERAKARAFLDILTEANADIHEGVSGELREKETALYAAIAALREDYAGAEDPAQRQETEAQLQQTRRDLAALKAEMRLKNPRYADLKYPRPAGVEAVQTELLDDQTTLLSYVLGDSSSYLFAVTQSDFRIYTLPPRREINESVTLFRSMLLHPGQFSFKMFASRANKLYRMLIEPAGALLQSRSELVIAPDGILHYLPFDVLITEKMQQQLSLTANFDYDLPYLIKEKALSYGPSATVLLSLRQNRNAESAPGLFLAYGDPVFGNEPAVEGTNGDDEVRGAVADELMLRYVTGAPDLRSFRSQIYRLPNTRTEVEGISRSFGESGTRVFTGTAASEENVKDNRELGDYRYVHFATHGLINERKPAYSGLVMTLDDDHREDGFLQMSEIFNLRLHAQLVVLSACQTGLGRIVRGEGVIGLTRAFMYAGAPEVLVTLWNVADASTAHFMQQFYHHLLSDRRGHRQALRKTKLEMLQSGQYAHPFYWAPFSLVGMGK